MWFGLFVGLSLRRPRLLTNVPANFERRVPPSPVPPAGAPDWPPSEPCPPEVAPGWCTLMTDCWAADPVARPSFTEVLERLRVSHNGVGMEWCKRKRLPGRKGAWRELEGIGLIEGRGKRGDCKRCKEHEELREGTSFAAPFRPPHHHERKQEEIDDVGVGCVLHARSRCLVCICGVLTCWRFRPLTAR